MVIQGLLSYILQTPGYRTRLDLKRTAEQLHQQTSYHVEILCDFYPVIKWHLARLESNQIQRGKLSPYSIMYSGVLSETCGHVQQFVNALRSINITPVFFIAGPPGSDRQRFNLVVPFTKSVQRQRTSHSWSGCFEKIWPSRLKFLSS